MDEDHPVPCECPCTQHEEKPNSHPFVQWRDRSRDLFREPRVESSCDVHACGHSGHFRRCHPGLP